MPDKPRLVVCAAIRNTRQRMICGARHFDSVMRDGIGDAWSPSEWDSCEQGFIDQYGVFMSRQEAHAVASAAGQIKYRCGGDEGCLYSENLY